MTTQQPGTVDPQAQKMPPTPSILALLPADGMAEIFGWLGARDTARCAMVCHTWKRVSKTSRALWRRFCYDDFGLAQGSESADWGAVYAYLEEKRQHFRLQEMGQLPLDDFFLPSTLVFSDDGSPQPGNPPENALKKNGTLPLRFFSEMCWCTNAFVDRDVDLVADLTRPCLVMKFEVANGGLHYSAPVKEALAFASMEVPDLEAARAFDGSNGSAWANELHKANLAQLPRKPNHPLAGFVFPGMPEAFGARQIHPCQPTVSRYVHFKLLSSSKCHDRVSNNIDVKNLFTYGTPLDDLDELIKGPEMVAPLPPDPSRFQRHHQIRDYPWHLHQAFLEREQEVVVEEWIRELERQLAEAPDEPDDFDVWIPEDETTNNQRNGGANNDNLEP